MTEDRVSGMPLPEDWGADKDGREPFMNSAYSSSVWMDQLRSSFGDLPRDHRGDGLICSCGEVCDTNLENYYIDQRDVTNQSQDPQLHWRMEQEEMIKEYLSMAYKDLMQKKETCSVKQERLRIAREELNAKLDELNRTRTRPSDLNSALAISNGGLASEGRGVKHNPEELKVEVEMVRQRIKKLVVELVRMRSSVSLSEKGIDALTMVNRMISDRGKGELVEVDEAGEMVKGIHNMNASIQAGEHTRRELIKSVADLSQHFLPTNHQLMSDPGMDSVETASQTELSGDLSKRYGILAKLRLNHNQNKRCIMEVLEQLIQVENQLIPCKIQFDENRLLLIEEKNKLLLELKRQQSPDSDDKIRNLEEDLYKVKEIFKKDIQLDGQTSNLTKQKVKLEEELLQRARINANLEMQIKSLHLSMNSISSGSSLGSLGSLSISSKGSQSSVALHDIYSMQELNKSMQQVNLSDLNSRVESMLQDQFLPSSSRSQLSGSMSFGSSSSYSMIGDVNGQSMADMGRTLPSFQHYPTVEEETEDGDEGFEGFEEETGAIGGSQPNVRCQMSNPCLDHNISKPPPSYEDHFQLNNGEQVQPLATCLYQQPSQHQQLNVSCPDGFCQALNYPVGKSYCLYEQPQYAMCSSLIPNQNTHNMQLPQVCQQQDLYQRQCATSSGKLSPHFQVQMNRIGNDYDGNNALYYNNECQKLLNNNVSYPNNLLSSNSLPSLLNTSLTNPMTSCGSESQIFRTGGMMESACFNLPMYSASNGSHSNVKTLEVNNKHLQTDKLQAASRNLLREFGVDKNNNKIQQLPQNQHFRNLLQQQQQHFSNNVCLRQTPLAKNTESSSAVSMPTCHITPPLNAFSHKSSSTSHLNEEATMIGYPHFISNPSSSLSLSSSSLGEDGSNLGSDSGVFECANRLNNVLSAQIHVQLMYDYAKQEILVCIERARNLSAVSIHSLSEVMFKVFLLPSATTCDWYVEDTDPSSPLHSLPSYSNLGKVFHFPVESEKVLSKTIQVYVLRLKDLNSLHQRSYSRVESVGMSLISLASFDMKSCMSSWYNILSFRFMDVDTNKNIPPSIPSLSPEIEPSLPSSVSAKRMVDFKNVTVCPLKEESSDESTAASSQASTLTRVEELEDASKSRAKVHQPITSSFSHNYEDSSLENNDMDGLSERKRMSPHVCDKETNTDTHKVNPCNPSTPYFMRKPIAPGSKLNREIAIRRWQTFSPTAVLSEEEDHNHKLNRSGSDSSVRRKNSHFNRQATHRQSIRLKMPTLSTRKHVGPLDLSKNRTSIDLMLDYQAYKTKLESLNREILALQTFKNRLEEAKERGENEASWLLQSKELQALLLKTSGTFREKACDRRKLSDITDLADRKIRKVKMEIWGLRARKSIIEIDRMVFKQKMHFFASPNDNLSFLDQVETEIDDLVAKESEEDDFDESRTETRTVPLSIKPSNPNNGNNDINNFENMLF